MKPRKKILSVASVVGAVLLLSVGYIYRVRIQDVIRDMLQSELPPAVAFNPSARPSTGVSEPAPSPFEGGYSTSQNYILESSPPVKTAPKDPLAFEGTLPKEVNLAVPFVSQAPLKDWNEPYQNACEETSVMMVDYFYKGRTGKIAADEIDATIKKLVVYQNNVFGDYKDTDVEKTAQLLRDYFGYTQVIVRPFYSADDLKRVLALGYPIIIPAAGKLLENPYFKNGGPAYHMLVIRGYTPTRFITNDPGTLTKGEAFTYSYDNILKSTHDWTGNKETVAQGARKMIVVIPD